MGHGVWAYRTIILGQREYFFDLDTECKELPMNNTGI